MHEQPSPQKPPQKSHLFAALTRFLDRQSKPVILIIGFIGLCFLSFLDFLTGPEYAFSIFYLLPILLVTWQYSHRAGVLFSFASALAWEVANRLAGMQYSSPLIEPFNVVIRLCFFLIIVYLLKQMRQALERERRMANTDFVTGVLNSRAFYKITEHELKQHELSRQHISLAYLDLDNFKYINDRLGHLAGDRLLRAVAETLQETMRSTDIIARLGGDEFAILLPRTSSEAAEAAVQRIRQALAQRMQKEGWPVTCSIGLITSTQPEIDVDGLIRRADDAMYFAKQKGKDTLEHNLLE